MRQALASLVAELGSQIGGPVNKKVDRDVCERCEVVAAANITGSENVRIKSHTRFALNDWVVEAGFAVIDLISEQLGVVRNEDDRR